MLRDKIVNIVENKSTRKKFFSIMTIIAILGYIWILCIGKVATEIRKNDLGLKSADRHPLEISSGITGFVYKKVQDRLGDLGISQRWEELHEILEKDLKSESYIIPYIDPDSGYEGKNLISYIRSSKGMGNQCNLIAFPINDINSIKVGTGFMYHLKEMNTYFLHKDIMVLFYESTSYSISTKNFIRQYLSDSNSMKGRCGTIRHAFTIAEFKEHGKVVSILSEGKNYNMNDQNLIYVTKNAFFQAGLKFDVNYPYSFTKNKFWKNLMSKTIEGRTVLNQNIKTAFNFLRDIGIDIPFASISNPILYLDSLKNQLFGNLHYPHNDFLDNGIYSITFLPYYSGRAKIIEEYISALETLVLNLDEIDTHEHSGTTQYFYAGSDHHVSMQTLPYPFLMFIAGLGLPLILKLSTSKSVNKEQIQMSLIKVLIVHAWGFTIYHVSNILLKVSEETKI